MNRDEIVSLLNNLGFGEENREFVVTALEFYQKGVSMGKMYKEMSDKYNLCEYCLSQKIEKAVIQAWEKKTDKMVEIFESYFYFNCKPPRNRDFLMGLKRYIKNAGIGGNRYRQADMSVSAKKKFVF